MASWMQGLCQRCVLQRFSPCLWLIFILLPVSFTEQMFLCWWSISYESFSSMDHIIGVRSKKAWPFQPHKDFLPSSRSFIILCFILKSMLYLDIWSFEVLFLAYRYPFVPVEFVEGIFCFWNWIDHVYVGLFWFSVVPLI